MVHGFRECFKLLLIGRDVYSDDPAGRTLASYRAEAVSLPDDVGEARDFTTFGCEGCPDVAGPSGLKADPDFLLCSDPIFK